MESVYYSFAPPASEIAENPSFSVARWFSSLGRQANYDKQTGSLKAAYKNKAIDQSHHEVLSISKEVSKPAVTSRQYLSKSCASSPRDTIFTKLTDAKQPRVNRKNIMGGKTVNFNLQLVSEDTQKEVEKNADGNGQHKNIHVPIDSRNRSQSIGNQFYFRLEDQKKTDISSTSGAIPSQSSNDKEQLSKQTQERRKHNTFEATSHLSRNFQTQSSQHHQKLSQQSLYSIAATNEVSSHDNSVSSCRRKQESKNNGIVSNTRPSDDNQSTFSHRVAPANDASSDRYDFNLGKSSDAKGRDPSQPAEVRM